MMLFSTGGAASVARGSIECSGATDRPPEGPPRWSGPRLRGRNPRKRRSGTTNLRKRDAVWDSAADRQPGATLESHSARSAAYPPSVPRRSAAYPKRHSSAAPAGPPLELSRPSPGSPGTAARRGREWTWHSLSEDALRPESDDDRWRMTLGYKERDAHDLANEHVLVTGASGFVGRAVMGALRRAGARVTAIDLVPFPAADVTILVGDLTDQQVRDATVTED